MKVFKNIKEILELCDEELIKNNKETYATLDYEDLLELKEMYEKIEKFYAGELYTAKQLKNAENIGDIIKENKELKEKLKRLECEIEIKKYCKVDEVINDLIYYKNLAKEYQGNCVPKSKIKEIIYPTPKNYIPLEVQSSEMYKRLEKLVEGE